MTTATPIAPDAPTEAQKRAGNYAKTHWRLHGMDIAIENLAGTKRSGVNHKGDPWEVTMPYHYGYIKGTEGADGDHLDCAVGPLMGSGTEAHIINQKGPTGEFDEHKVFIGYPSREAAIHAFRAGRSDNPDDVMGSVITVPIDELGRWIEEGNLQDEAVLKSETAHVKAHYRIVNGKIVYIPNYDRTVNGEHPSATMHQRTVVGVNQSGQAFIRATDSDDRDLVLSAAHSLGVNPVATRPSGANHHGRQSAYPTMIFASTAEAHAVMDAVRLRHGDRAHEHTVHTATRGAGAVQAALQRMATATRTNNAAVANAAAAQAPSPSAALAAAAQSFSQDRRFFTNHIAGQLDRRVVLENTSGTHNKHYIIDLRQVGEGKWVVNAGNGSIDSRSLVVRTKTVTPMSQAAANALVTQIKAEKVRGGYVGREDSASPRLRYTAMDNYLHPSLNQPAQAAAAAIVPPQGTSVPIPVRPAAPGAGAGPSGAPRPAPVTGPPAGSGVTASQYQTARDAAFAAGDRARGTDSQHTKQALQNSMEAIRTHAIGLDLATRGAIPDQQGKGPRWHQERLTAWKTTAANQWRNAMTSLNPAAITSTLSSGRGFEAAKKAANDAKDMIDMRPTGAALPAGMTEAKLTEAKTGIDSQIAALDFGAKLERFATTEQNPQTAVSTQIQAINSETLNGGMTGEQKTAAIRFAGALAHLNTIHTATTEVLAQHPEADDARAAATTMAQAVRQARDAALPVMAHPTGIWASATKPVVDKLAQLADKAAKEATRLESRPKTSDPRFARAHETHQQAAATAHAIATGTTDRGKITAALDAYKKSAVATYHHAMTLPKGEERKAAIRKAEEHAQHARDFAAKLQGR
jgi:hypothetical protein